MAKENHESPAIEAVDADEGFECPKCHRIFPTEAEVIEHVKTCKVKVWEPTKCPKCGKLYKRQSAYEAHVAKCTGPRPKKERKVLSPEERAKRRKEQVRRWVESTTAVVLRLPNDSEELKFIKAKAAEFEIGLATYVKRLVQDAIKRESKKKVKKSKASKAKKAKAETPLPAPEPLIP